MLKLKCIEYPKHNNHYWDFVDEFSGHSYNGKTFQSMGEAVDFANEHIVYNQQGFDLYSINKPSYTIETRNI